MGSLPQGETWGHNVTFHNSDFYLGHQIQMKAETVGFMTVGVDRNINLSCRFPREIDTNQEFNVNQDLKGASQDGAFVYQARIQINFHHFYDGPSLMGHIGTILRFRHVAVKS